MSHLLAVSSANFHNIAPECLIMLIICYLTSIPAVNNRSTIEAYSDKKYRFHIEISKLGFAESIENIGNIESAIYRGASEIGTATLSQK